MFNHVQNQNNSWEYSPTYIGPHSPCHSLPFDRRYAHKWHLRGGICISPSSRRRTQCMTGKYTVSHKICSRFRGYICCAGYIIVFDGSRWFMRISQCVPNSPPPPIAAYMRQWIGSALVQIMACRIFRAKSLFKPILGCCYLDPYEQISVILWSKYNIFTHENTSEKIGCEMAANLSS